jgi:hypothetical protein
LEEYVGLFYDSESNENQMEEEVELESEVGEDEISFLEEYVEYESEVGEDEIGFLEEYVEYEPEIGEEQKVQEVIDLTSDTEEDDDEVEIIDLTKVELSVETTNIMEQGAMNQGSIATWESCDDNNNSKINSVTTIAMEALTSPWLLWALTTAPV